MTFSLGHLIAIVTIPALVILNIPALIGGVSIIEVGDYRLAWTRMGGSYYGGDGGTYKVHLNPAGYAEHVPAWTEKHWRWPWETYMPEYRAFMRRKTDEAKLAADPHAIVGPDHQHIKN